MINNSYTVKSIKHFEGLEGVRIRPGMYIGGTDTSGYHHLFWEMLDNSIDEVLAGYANFLEVVIYKDGAISIKDNGRGIPVGKHPSGMNTLELIFTKLHAGGKFGGKDSGYVTAGGLHGVGAAVVNALSDFLEVTVWRDGKVYTMKFEDGGRIAKTLTSKKTDEKETGTEIKFLPSKKVFNSSTTFELNLIAERLRESAFLLKGLRINFIDQRMNAKEEFYYENNLLDYLEYMKRGEFVTQPIPIQTTSDDIYIDAAIRYSTDHSNSVVSFVNSIKTINGGTHETGMIHGIRKAINKAIKELNISKREVERRDILEGLNAVISVRIPSAQLEFEGQTKTKLRSTFIGPIVERAVFDVMLNFLLRNKVVAETIINKALLSIEAREASKKAREAVRAKKTHKKETKLLSGKLTPAQSNVKMDNEIFIVEGDSAGGTAKMGRDKKHQAILPLRGKVLNSHKSKLQEILKNEELSTLIHAIGCGIQEYCDPSKSNYGKIIIMTDADTDGAHIQTLLLTFFYNYMRELIEQEMVYVALPPLYKVKYGKTEKYLWSDQELNKLRLKHNKLTIQRYKGLGEMNDDQLWDTTMDPSNRHLLQVLLTDAERAKHVVDTLMSENSQNRREWIQDNVDFSIQDSFIDVKGEDEQE